MLTYQARSSLPIVRFADLPIYLDAPTLFVRLSALAYAPAVAPVTSGKKKNLNRKAQVLFVYGRNDRPLSATFFAWAQKVYCRVWYFRLLRPALQRTNQGSSCLQACLQNISARQQRNRVTYIPQFTGHSQG